MRLLFDAAVLFYVDRFCPEKPPKEDSQMLDRFIMFAFVWAYSHRAQYENLGWQSAQNYIGIKNGHGYADKALKELIEHKDNLDKFKNFLLQNVRLVHYRAPKDIDLNSYFEVMNSRGEQLEKHEIVKARPIDMAKPPSTSL